MYTAAHCGTGRGSLAEVGTAETRLLFVAGAGLPPSSGSQDWKAFQMEGLTRGTPVFDWVFLTGQWDCLGLLDSILPGIDVLAGDETVRALQRIAQAKGRPEPELYFGFREGRTVRLNDIQVTPLGGGAAFLLEAEGKNVAYAEDRLTDGALKTLRERTGTNRPLNLLLWENGDLRFAQGGVSRVLPDGERAEIE